VQSSGDSGGDDVDDYGTADGGSAPSLSGGGDNDSSLGGATSSTIGTGHARTHHLSLTYLLHNVFISLLVAAIGLVAGMGLLIAVAFLLQKCGCVLFGGDGRHSLLRNNSDHGEDDNIVFDDFHSSSFGAGRSLFGKFGGGRASPGVQMGNTLAGPDDDDIMEITL
jgi:hypothetical protein